MSIEQGDSSPPNEPEPRPPQFHSDWERDTWLSLATGAGGVAYADMILSRLQERSGPHYANQAAEGGV